MSVSPVSTPEGRATAGPGRPRPPSPTSVRPATKTVAEGDHAAAATYLMHHARTTSLVVMDFQAGKPVAIITAADIARAVSEGKDLNEIRIHDLLTARPAPISAATPVRDAAEAMLTAGWRQLPVIGDGDSTGIVDIADILGALPGQRMNSPAPDHPAG